MHASPEAMPLSLPKDLEVLTNLFVQRFPEIGDDDAASAILDDLMLDGYFQTVVGNAAVVKTARWDTKTRKPLDPEINNLPKDQKPEDDA